jgi:hypothetical protein
MNYQQLTQKLLANGFTRVERDDRIIDIFPDQIRLKGVELWERWSPQKVTFIKLSIPYHTQKTEAFSAPKEIIESLLKTNKTTSLESLESININQLPLN